MKIMYFQTKMLKNIYSHKRKFDFHTLRIFLVTDSLKKEDIPLFKATEITQNI